MNKHQKGYTAPLMILKTKLAQQLILRYADEELLIYLAEIEAKIKNFCNIKRIPEELSYTWVNMTRDLISYEFNLLEVETSETDKQGVITAIKEGDTSINFGGSDTSSRAETLKGHSSYLDDLIFNYKDDLLKFRRLSW